MIRLSTAGTLTGNVFVGHYNEAGEILAGTSDSLLQRSPVGVDLWTASDVAAASLPTAAGTSAASQAWASPDNRFHSLGTSTGSGGTSATDFLQIHTSSLFLSTFRLTTSYDYVWNSVVDSVGGSGSFSLVALGSPAGYVFTSAIRSGSLTFAQSGRLDPGDYNIIGEAETEALAGPLFGHPILTKSLSSYTLDFRLTPSPVVPEPATLILVGTGAAGLWWRRKTAWTSKAPPSLDVFPNRLQRSTQEPGKGL